MADIIQHKLGKPFAKGLVFGGYFILGAGILATVTGSLSGLFLVAIGTFASFTTQGILLNYEAREYMDYINILGLKLGKWRSYETYPYLTIMRRKESITGHSRSMGASTTMTEVHYDVFLLSQSHRQKLLIKRLGEKENAKWAAQDLAERLGVEFVAYNPAVSAQTRMRRQRR